MPSTEFLLYLVSVTLVVVLVMNYMNQDNNKEDKTHYVLEMLRRQERRDRIAMDKNDKNDKNDKQYRDNEDTESNWRSNQDNNSQNAQCTNHQCLRNGRCSCNRRINVNVNNLNGGSGLIGPTTDPLRRFDYNAVHDEFTPPFRRSYYDDYSLNPGLYPTYTRGPPGRFRKVGTLIAQGVAHNDKYKFLNLNGREKYPGRDYEYFVTSVDNESKIKFYIEGKGKEIRDGDTVNVKNLEGYTFIFSEDEDLSPKYDPYFVY